MLPLLTYSSRLYEEVEGLTLAIATAKWRVTVHVADPFSTYHVELLHTCAASSLHFLTQFGQCCVLLMGCHMIIHACMHAELSIYNAYLWLLAYCDEQKQHRHTSPGLYLKQL